MDNAEFELCGRYIKTAQGEWLSGGLISLIIDIAV